MSTTLWSIYREFINKTPIGSVFRMKQLIKFMNSHNIPYKPHTLNYYLAISSSAGYLVPFAGGFLERFRVVKHITYNSNHVRIECDIINHK